MSTLTLISGGNRRRIAALLIAVLGVAGLGAVAAPRADAAGMGCVADPDWATIKTAWADEVLVLTNAHRATLGLAPLVQSSSLTAAAEWKAAHMAAFGYMSHDDPSPPVDRTWDQRIEDCGYTYGMGENIAYGYRTPAAVVAGWIGSTGHRENIENPGYRVIGVGAAIDDGPAYWAQTFGTRLDAGEKQEPVPSATETIEKNDDEAGTNESDLRWGRVSSLMRAWAWANCARRWCIR